MSWNDEAFLEGAAQAIRDFVATGRAYEISHPVQLTSIGGSGTTALVRHLVGGGVELQPGPAQWPFKHRRRTPTADEVPDGFRVLYLVGDPRDAVLSVFRRGIQKGHFLALNDDPRDPEPASLARLESLDTFLEAGIDDFRLADHIAGWLHHPPGYEVMVLRFALIEDVWSEVAEFVGLPADHPPFVLRERHSDWRDTPEPNRGRLDAMYGELAARIEAMPAVRVV